MALGSNPDRSHIFGELEESTYRNGGVGNDSLKDMWNYVYGSGSYSRDAFGGDGVPVVDSTLTVDNGNSSGELDLTFNISNDGGFSMTFVAEYWEQTNDASQMGGNYQEIGIGTGTGQFTRTLTGLTDGVTYDVRVTAYNKFNNSGNYPTAPDTNSAWDWTNTSSGTALPSKLATPILNTTEYQEFEAGVYITFDYFDPEDGFDVGIRINGQASTSPELRQCDKNVGTNNSAIEILHDAEQFLSSSDTVEVRVRATSAETTDSDWTAWTTVSLVTSIPSCPL